MVYQSDEMPLDIGFSLAGLLPMHCVYCNFDTIKIILSWYKATYRAYLSGMYIALIDVNVRGGNVLRPFARDIGTGQSLYYYSR